MKSLSIWTLSILLIFLTQGCSQLPISKDKPQSLQEKLVGTWSCTWELPREQNIAMRAIIHKSITEKNISEQVFIYLTIYGFMGDVKQTATSTINASAESEYELSGMQIIQKTQPPKFKVTQSSSQSMMMFSQHMFDNTKEKPATYTNEIVELSRNRLVLRSTKFGNDEVCTRYPS